MKAPLAVEEPSAYQFADRSLDGVVSVEIWIGIQRPGQLGDRQQ